MKPISFSNVNKRKLYLQSNFGEQKISYSTVSNNLNVKNLISFIESGCNGNYNTHFRQSIRLYDKLLSGQKVSNSDKNKILKEFNENLFKVIDFDSIYKTLAGCKNIDFNFDETINILENCDRVIRNEEKLAKRFDFRKTINDNIAHGTKHTVFELCSLLDTYSISSKAKMNIALENVLYSLYKCGHKVNIDEATEYIVEYFLTRDTIITDKEYKGYINVLEHNEFIDSSLSNISYIFEADNTEGFYYADKMSDLIDKCDDNELVQHLNKALLIRNEKDASHYIDDTISKIISKDVDQYNSNLLLKSIYFIPLIGNVSKEFIEYKMELSKKQLEIKNKLTCIDDEKEVRGAMNITDLSAYSDYVTKDLHFKNYILDDKYMQESDVFKILESENSSDNHVKDIINTFKASNEKSPSKFKNMISRIMTKSPENIIEETPNIFACVRIMLYLGVAATGPIGVVFSAILALVNKLLTTHLDMKQAEKLLKHLRSEKEKAEKKLDKLSGKEKTNQEEYIKCLKDCIKKTEDFIRNIDDEHEELNNSDDDFDFDFDDINFESVLESGSLVNIENKTIYEEALDIVSSSLDEEILKNIAPIFDNCSTKISDDFYNLVNNIKESATGSLLETCNEIIKNKGIEKIHNESSFLIEYAMTNILEQFVNEAKDEKVKGNKKEPKRGSFNLNTLKMAFINFKKKFRDLKGKEQEIWRNIDINSERITRDIQKALTSDRREAIIKGSIIPSFSKCIKAALTVGAVGIFTGPTGAIITAVGMFGASKYLNHRERKILFDEIDTELQVVEKQIQLAENEGDMNQYRFLLNYQKKLTREKFRIKYGMQMIGRPIPELKGRDS